ncbi:heparan sulfate glucosamine 3-O-sulfotransferase 5-like [Apostichopus japonicus]|uniref:heparan sulfate glucosamine 3-O-sulfotransferase 5-like n=1 Tax=Stichopus japonicus TaxID=307972 RepID=UPI003AB18EB3
MSGGGGVTTAFSSTTEFEKGLVYCKSKLPFSYKNEINLEKSPSYFPTESVPKRIKESLGGKVKFIICVRDPVERAISDFHHTSYLRMRHRDMWGRTRESEGERFASVFIDENGNLKSNQTVITESLYAVHLRHWLQYFTLDQFLIIHVEDIRRNLSKVMTEVEAFLNIEPFFKFEMFKYHRRSCVKLPTSDNAYCAPIWGTELAHPRLNKTVTRMLRDYYRPFNREFESMTNRTFSWTYL